MTIHKPTSPLVNGVQQAPQHVEWGDGTLDEMCLLYVTFMEPYRPLKPAESPACYGVEECIADCGDLRLSDALRIR